MQGRTDTTLRVIDVGSGEVAAQHGIRRIPHLILFRDGKRVTAGVDSVLTALEQ